MALCKSSIESENVKVQGNLKNEWASLALRAHAINCLLGNMEIHLKSRRKDHVTYRTHVFESAGHSPQNTLKSADYVRNYLPRQSCGQSTVC